MDGIEMNSDLTVDAMNLMDEAGRGLTTGWGAANSRLSSLSGQLGQGELGAAYLDRYQQAAADTVAAMEQHCGQPGQLAAVGHQCVGLYASADQAAATMFPPPA